MIAIADYGLGNIQAFLQIYRRLNIEARAASRPSDFDGCSRIILPGVGSFDWAMDRLDTSGLRAPLETFVLESAVPVLGVCVGMQMMCDSSDEGSRPGLGWIKGRVKRFDGTWSSDGLPLPHMGWNDVRPRETDSLFAGLDDPRYYFLHSYYVEAERPVDVLAVTDYGREFTSSVRSGNIYGTQFHPEKSHDWGVRLLKNFAER